ncbi:hypothetical protein [Gemmatimonas aurantiaca]|uniref:hypothetical protein n=1 Tax=Gemmatimonas aurantiaca TaxID=173480 RepID=UPI0012EAA1C1|nr:hypothetical protein [Gemmatimonas aurantiaca]
MLIELSDEFLSFSNFDDDSWATALDILLSSFREGSHLLLISSALAKHLCTSAGLSQRGKATITHAANDRPERLSLLPKLSVRVLVSPTSPTSVDSFQEGSVIRVPLTHFQHLASVQKTTVLGENILDSEFAVLIARSYAASQRIRPLLAFEARGGGGSTIDREFDQVQQSRKLCIAIVDSDKQAPDAPLGNTATAILRMRSSDKPWAEVVLLAVRESENALSLRLLSDLCETEPNFREAFSRVANLCENGFGEALSYLDLKKGLRMDKVYSIEHSPAKDWWISNIIELSGRITPLVHTDCMAEERCKTPTACECQVALGFGDNLLKHSIEMLNRQTAQRTNQALCERTHDLWSSVGKSVFSWCCASPPLRT